MVWTWNSTQCWPFVPQNYRRRTEGEADIFWCWYLFILAVSFASDQNRLTVLQCQHLLVTRPTLAQRESTSEHLLWRCWAMKKPKDTLRDLVWCFLDWRLSWSWQRRKKKSPQMQSPDGRGIKQGLICRQVICRKVLPSPTLWLPSKYNSFPPTPHSHHTQPHMRSSHCCLEHHFTGYYRKVTLAANPTHFSSKLGWTLLT